MTPRARRNRQLPIASGKLLRFKVAVRRAFASLLLSLLLLTTLVWGGCISCEQYFMWPSAKGCCSPNGHCKTKAPSQKPDRECKQIAFDHHKSANFHVELQVVAGVGIKAPVCGIEALERWRGANLIEPSPPDLQILNSTFLI